MDPDAVADDRRLRTADATATQALFPVEGPLPPSGRLYRNDLRVEPDGTRTPRFADVSAASGIAADGYGMGVAAGDIDNDGWVDLYLTHVGRGAAFGDVDNDGDTDVLVSNANAPPQLLVNHVGNRRHWLGLKLAGGEDGPRHMLGSRVAIMRDGASTIWRRARADGSYASANDPRVLIGLRHERRRAAGPGPVAERPRGRVAGRRHRQVDHAARGIGNSLDKVAWRARIASRQAVTPGGSSRSVSPGISMTEDTEPHFSTTVKNNH